MKETAEQHMSTCRWARPSFGDLWRQESLDPTEFVQVSEVKAGSRP